MISDVSVAEAVATELPADWFRALADAAPVLIWATDATGAWTYVNEYWREFTGRPRERERGSGWLDLLNPDDRPNCLRDYAQAFAERRRFRLWYRMRNADGRYRWLECNGAPRYDASGEFTGYAGVCTDVTDLRDAARDVARHAERLSGFRPARTRPDRWLFEWDVSTDALRFPGATEGPFGHALDRVRTLADWYECLHPDDRPMLTARMHRYVTVPGGALDEYRVVRPDGEVVHVLSAAVMRRDPQGRPVNALGILLDVSDDRRREVALEMQARVLDSLTEAVTVCDERGRILLTNRACDEMFRYPRGELVGQHVRVLSGATDARLAEILADMRHDLEHEGRWAGELVSRRRNGATFVSRTAVSPLEIGDARGWILTREDVTEEKRLEAAMLAASQHEQLRIAGELHDGLAQELVGLSMNLQAEVQSLQGAHPESARRLSALVDDVRRAIGTCRQLAEGVSAFTLADGGLEVALQRLAVRESRNYGGTCETHVQPGAAAGLSPAQAYELFRIAQESTRNAFRHGGASAVAIALERGPDALELRVTDDGTGFDTAEAPGGLGLRIMSFRASQAGGRLTVESAPGRGTAVVCRV